VGSGTELAAFYFFKKLSLIGRYSNGIFYEEILLVNSLLHFLLKYGTDRLSSNCHGG
jgi:hypothetical protein